MTRALIAVLAVVLSAGSAEAVIIDSGDGTGNTEAPAPDPGWDYVGIRGGSTAVYLGNGWVITANHVGVGAVELGGVLHAADPESVVRLENEDASLADLKVFQIADAPFIGPMPIAKDAPPVGTDAILIGGGRDRGPATTWEPSPGVEIDGWLWGVTKTLRWGTNRIEYDSEVVAFPGVVTYAVATDFSESGDPTATPHESQAANGDSGGALFVPGQAGYELAGIIFTVGPYVGQPADTALYGNLTYAADLSYYRDQIIALVRPACSDEIDNDGDGLIDHDGAGVGDPDPECVGAPLGQMEDPPVCGLGVELALLLPPLMWLRRRSLR